MTIVSGLSAALGFQVINATRERQEAAFTQRPEFSRDADHFRANAPNISTVEQLLDDRRSLRVVLSAFQLESEINNTAFIRTVLEEDPGADESLVNRLADPRFGEFAVAFRGLAEGNQPLANPAFVDDVLDRFTDNEFEIFAGTNSPGIREALFFQRNIGSAETVNDILADRTLKEVARVALGFPEEIGLLDFDQQQPRFEQALNIEDFQDPEFVESFIQRFLIQTDIQNRQTDPIVSLFDTGPVGPRPFNIPGTVNVLV